MLPLMAEEVVFPPVEFVRTGPPIGVKDIHRQDTEKWGRVMMVTPRPLETADRTRYDFVEKGPVTLPLAVRREDSDAGSRDAWQFFTHPYAVFPADATYYNVSGNGCLGSRIFVRGEEGVLLYDEVGAGLPNSERVSESFPGALGVLRNRVLGDLKVISESEMALDLFELDLDLLEVFNLTVGLLRDENPLKALAELYPQLLKPSVHTFAWDAFDEREHDIMRALANGEGGTLKEMSSTFRVIRRDFTRITDVTDARGRQAILELLNDFEAFEKEHGEHLSELSHKIEVEVQTLEAIKDKVKQLQAGAKQQSRVTRMFSRSESTVNQLKAEAVKAVRAKRALEAEFGEIPGYDQLQGLTERVRSFEVEIKRIFDLAHGLITHTVSREDLDALRKIVEEKIRSDDEKEQLSGYRQYGLRLRADVLPKLLQTYSLSAYVLRRPDAMNMEGASARNVRRINDLAKRLIEYFRYVKYGKGILGEAYDDTWAQVVSLETQL